MELCRTEIKHQRRLNDKQTADIIKQTAVKATDRMKYIQNWINRSSIDQDPVLKEFNIDISLRVTELDGRVINFSVIYQSISINNLLYLRIYN
jgi:hypothetical protein